MGSLGVLSLVTFFAQAKKVIKKPLSRARCARPAVGMLWNLSLTKPFAAHNAGGFSFFVHFFAPRKETNQRNEPETPAVSQALPFGRLLPLRGGGIGLKGAPSATISSLSGAVRSERLYRAFAKLGGLQWA